MKIAIFATCPPKTFSGGRYHALMIAYVLARRGHEAYFITDNEPIFDEDLRPISPENPVKIIVADEKFEVLPLGDFDAVFVAPQMPRHPYFYKSAVRFAKTSNAALFLINYESANWFNAFSPVKRPENKWDEWVYIANQGACVVSSTHESDRFAREFYVNLPPEADFAVWQPAINSVACDDAKEQEREKLIVLFSRPTDKHKGGGDIKDAIGPELRGYTIGVVIGNPKKSEDFLSDLRSKAKNFDIKIQAFFGISDRQKFILLKRASAVVFPSYFEGYGYPPMEALAADVPCVAYDLPVLRENCGDKLFYAPLGDVQALKQQLVKALSSDLRRTSTDPGTISLTDVDHRGEALEKLISRYRAKLGETQDMDPAQFLNLCEVSSGSSFRVRGQTFIAATVTVPKRIKEAQFKELADVPIQFFERGWNSFGWQYSFFFGPISDGTGFTLEGKALLLGFLGKNGRVELPLPKVKVRRGPARWFKNRNFTIKRVSRAGNRYIISGWVFPEKAYDALFLLDQQGRFVSLQSGMKDNGRKGLCAVGTRFYGFSSQVIDSREFDIGFMQLIVLRQGRVVAKGRVNAADQAAKAKPIQEIGSWHKNSSENGSFKIQKLFKVPVAKFSSGEPTQPVALTCIRKATAFEWGSSLYKEGLRSASKAIGATFASRQPSGQVRVEDLWEIENYHFDKEAGTFDIELSGRDLNGASVEIWGGDMSYLGEVEFHVPRTGKKTNANETRICSSLNFHADPAEGAMLRLFKNGHFLAQKAIHNLLTSPSKRLRVDDCLFDRTWKILWVRGSLHTPGSEVREIEIFHQGTSLGKAVVDERLSTSSGRSFHWRFECVVDSDLPIGSELSVHACLADGEEFKVVCIVADTQTWQNSIVCTDHNLEYAKSGKNSESRASRVPYSSEALQILKGVEPLPDPRKIVLLVAHNLNAIEREEKRSALNLLRRELNKNGIELIVLHHSKKRCGCEIPEVNFFDPDLEALAKITNKTLLAVDPKELNYAQRMLYGFIFALNRRPKSWADIEAQTFEESAKVSAAVRALQPSMLLLWHQWNSLMLLARAAADGSSLPSAVLHEGMLPGTLTIDANGMMAESDAVGCMLEAEDDASKALMERAGRIITEIKGKQLDRKPFAGAPAATEIIGELKRRGAKTVFYAGANDWQSGNLPSDHPRAKLHSPFFEDTEEGLEHLLRVAERLDFYVIYKPHPNLFPRPPRFTHDRLVYVREPNASECIMQVDAVATLLSSLAYISLAHGVPTVLMGRNTLSDTGAAYELAAADELERCVRSALEKQDLEQRLYRFQQHVAALLKDHLYPYGGKTDFAALGYEDAVKKMVSIMQGTEG